MQKVSDVAAYSPQRCIPIHEEQNTSISTEESLTLPWLKSARQAYCQGRKHSGLTSQPEARRWQCGSNDGASTFAMCIFGSICSPMWTLDLQPIPILTHVFQCTAADNELGAAHYFRRLHGLQPYLPALECLWCAHLGSCVISRLPSK